MVSSEVRPPSSCLDGLREHRGVSSEVLPIHHGIIGAF